jgi:hypothetical protein
MLSITSTAHFPRIHGSADHFLKDHIFMIFGVPRIHEDDPLRAIKAATEIHDIVEKMNL